MNKLATPEVEAIGQMHFEGNVIPSIWFKNISFENGKADLVSINILSEIVYWYRPTHVRDETTGNLKELKRKFAGSALQKSKKDLAEHFGLSERQVKDSLARLEDLGLIKREFRTIQTEFGPMPNVQFILIIPDKIREITFSKNEGVYDVQTSDRGTENGGYDVQTYDPPTFERQRHIYNTKTTTENNNTPPNPLKGGAAKAACVSKNSSDSNKDLSDNETYVRFGSFVRLKQSEYDSLCEKHAKKLVDEIVEEMNDYCASLKTKGYQDYAAAIRQWIRRRKQSPRFQGRQEYQVDDKFDLKIKNHGIGIKCQNHFKGSFKSHNVYVNDRVDYIEIGNDKIYYDNDNFEDLLKHTLRKYGLPT